MKAPPLDVLEAELRIDAGIPLDLALRCLGLFIHEFPDRRGRNNGVVYCATVDDQRVCVRVARTATAYVVRTANAVQPE